MGLVAEACRPTPLSSSESEPTPSLSSIWRCLVVRNGHTRHVFQSGPSPSLWAGATAPPPVMCRRHLESQTLPLSAGLYCSVSYLRALPLLPGGVQESRRAPIPAYANENRIRTPGQDYCRVCGRSTRTVLPFTSPVRPRPYCIIKHYFLH